MVCLVLLVTLKERGLARKDTPLPSASNLADCSRITCRASPAAKPTGRAKYNGATPCDHAIC
jgi:hypothetical protein